MTRYRPALIAALGVGGLLASAAPATASTAAARADRPATGLSAVSLPQFKSAASFPKAHQVASRWLEHLANTTTVAQQGAVYFANATTTDADISVIDPSTGTPQQVYTGVPAGLSLFAPVLLPAGNYTFEFTESGNASNVLATGNLAVAAGGNVTFAAEQGVHVPVTYVNRYAGLPATVERISFRNANPSAVDAYVDGQKVGTIAQKGSFDLDTTPGEHQIALTAAGAAPTASDEVPFLPSPAALITYTATPTTDTTDFPAGFFGFPTALNSGYTMAAADGGIFNYGTQSFQGSTGSLKLNQPVVGAASSGVSQSYYEVARDGGIFAFGPGASFVGSLGSTKLNAPIVGMATTGDGGGYWLVASDGGVFAFGDAPFLGSMGGKKLNAPIVGIAADAVTGGYYLVGADGGIFNFGGALALGSLGGMKLNAPIVGMSLTASGLGYWLTASDGGVFSFGDATFLGSTGGMKLNAPVVGVVGSADGLGYSLVARDGGVFTYGDAGFYGSVGGKKLNQPVVTGF